MHRVPRRCWAGCFAAGMVATLPAVPSSAATTRASTSPEFVSPRLTLGPRLPRTYSSPPAGSRLGGPPAVSAGTSLASGTSSEATIGTGHFALQKTVRINDGGGLIRRRRFPGGRRVRFPFGFQPGNPVAERLVLRSQRLVLGLQPLDNAERASQLLSHRGTGHAIVFSRWWALSGGSTLSARSGT